MKDKQFEKHESGLVRRLGMGTAFLLVVSAMVGSGVFKKVAPMSYDTGSAFWILACWIMAGLVSWFGALSNAEVASQIAEPGGQYEYFKRIFGKPLAFLYGWTGFTVVQSATAASVAYVFSESVNSLWALPLIDLWGIENLSVKLLTVMVLWIITGINLGGVHQGERVSNVLTSLVIVCILGITLLCFGHGQPGLPDWSLSAGKGSSIGPGALFLGMMSAFWAYEGWNNLGFLAGEIRNPTRNVPLALAAGVGFVMLLYVGINASYLFVLPVESFQKVHEEGNTIAAVSVVQSFLGPVGRNLIVVVIMVATFGSANNTLMSAARVYFAMARDGVFFKKAGKIHPSTNVPNYALLLQAVWASVLVFSGSFDQLTDMLIFAAFIFYGLGGAGLFILRYQKARVRPENDAIIDHEKLEKSGFRVPGYPFIPGFFILFCIGLVVNSIFERPMESGMGLLLMATGIPFYFYWSRKHKPAK
jgi:APA family basic amino acid/polyamine antiporter